MNQNYYDSDYLKTNRDKKMESLRVTGWCDGCDTYLVEYGKKCPKCGYRFGNKKRFKR